MLRMRAMLDKRSTKTTLAQQSRSAKGSLEKIGLISRKNANSYAELRLFVCASSVRLGSYGDFIWAEFKGKTSTFDSLPWHERPDV